MKNTITFGVAALAGGAAAFPAAMEAFANPTAHHNFKRTDGTAFVKHAKRLNGISPGFDASAQYISTSGKYQWVAPSASDNRGPCPGLNAFANHGYLPHNGVASIQQFIDATFHVVGMGQDLGGFLAVYGAIFDGNLEGWSIGGPTAELPLISGLLGTPEGISGSHNKYEGDVSPSRGDLYQYGNDYLVVQKQFNQMYSYQAAVSNDESNYDLGVLTDLRVSRFQQSIDENPYFFNNFFSGLEVQPAAYTFIYRFMANRSAENPEGQLTQDVLKSWFSMTGDYPNLQYTPGYERIPDNWYRRAFGDEYTIPFFESDLLAAAVQHPQFLDVGGNVDGVNTFTPIDIGNLTGGVYNAQNLAQGHNLMCFVYQSILQQGPDILENIFLNPSAANSKLTSALASAFGSFVCPQLNSVQQGQFGAAADPYPGYSKLKKDGTY